MKNGQLIKDRWTVLRQEEFSYSKLKQNLNGIKKFQGRLIFSVTCKTIYYHFSNVSHCTWVFLFVCFGHTYKWNFKNQCCFTCVPLERCVWERSLRNNTKSLSFRKVQHRFHTRVFWLISLQKCINGVYAQNNTPKYTQKFWSLARFPKHFWKRQHSSKDWCSAGCESMTLGC